MMLRLRAFLNALATSRLHAGVAAITAAVLMGAAIPAHAQSPVFFDDIYFGGESFTAGSDMSFVGWDWNDRVSSISVPAGMTVTIYEHGDYGGDYLTLQGGDTLDLRDYWGPGPDGTWNDQMSSLTVSGGSFSPPPSNIWTVLINGTGDTESIPDWMEAGSAEFNAIAATYGTPPEQFHWVESHFLGVLFPFYSGIWYGSFSLANFIHALPPGEVNLVAHSHGGNVAILTTWWLQRPVRHMINLGTPINYDIWRYVNPAVVYSRCQISSWADWTQFFGASALQVYTFMDLSYQAFEYGRLATLAFLAGDEDLGWQYSGLATLYLIAGYDWFESTKIEVEGTTWGFEGLKHRELHDPPVWNAIAGYCAVN